MSYFFSYLTQVIVGTVYKTAPSGEDFLDNSIHTKSRAIRSLISAIVSNKIGYWLVKFVPVVFSFLALNDIIKNIKNDKGK